MSKKAGLNGEKLRRFVHGAARPCSCRPCPPGRRVARRFTWGVLDRLLEEPWLKIEAISGTSAGAMNAAVLVSGHMQRRRRRRACGAGRLLEAGGGRGEVQSAAALADRSADEPLDARHVSPAYLAMDLMSRVVSPYNLNPLGLNPIESILAQSIDFAHLAEAPIKLFITATNVHTGRGRVFRNKEIAPGRAARLRLPSDDVPGDRDRRRALLGRRLRRQSDHHAARARKRRARYDPRPDQPAGAAGYPAHGERDPQPPQRDFLQCAAAEGIADDRAAAAGGRSRHGRRGALGHMRTHRIMTDKLAEFGASSKLNAEGAFLALLKEEGRRSADAFLAEHGDDVGKRSSADLDVLLAEC